MENYYLPPDKNTALQYMHDAVGIRIVCSFVDDVYAVADWLSSRSEFEMAAKKDYICLPEAKRIPQSSPDSPDKERRRAWNTGNP
ncbi:MAG: hypothetical protein LIO86_07355 [Lachnospiraceae bacterium]|nr:hypothetical protein [Lachnospiraceae bacterium]